uniref:4a-hydroxytetrahydrobiopterin dehydratase n=1 Tax=Trypanosoma congolense (strain IL3000) TaxID=1068625 RepID=G0URX9_TRYCI|nr:conserved hypothetical protein [Trypanosoma congolense IL3000]
MRMVITRARLRVCRACSIPARCGPLGCGASADGFSRRCKGDYGFNIFHNSNPQHGGSYARHERRMRDDEVEDFLKSVKGWVPVDECVASEAREAGPSAEGEGPAPLTIFTGEEALKREFTFATFREAYLFMGRLWAFCYGSDKYPNVTWDGTTVTVYIYSPSFRGLSKREARLAAFLNDQYNMFKKSKRQQSAIIDSVVKQAAIENMIGDEVGKILRHREQERRKPLTEAVEGTVTVWETLISDGKEPS